MEVFIEQHSLYRQMCTRRYVNIKVILLVRPLHKTGSSKQHPKVGKAKCGNWLLERVQHSGDSHRHLWQRRTRRWIDVSQVGVHEGLVQDELAEAGDQMEVLLHVSAQHHLDDHLAHPGQQLSLLRGALEEVACLQVDRPASSTQ